MLEIDEDQSFQGKVWVLQRMGWGLLLLFLALAGLGFTGPSSLTRVVEEKDGHRLEYPRFARIGNAFELIVTPASGAEIFISREILRKSEIEIATPPPEKGVARSDGVSFQFGNAGQGEIYVQWRPREAGWIKGKVVVGTPPIEFTMEQFVYY